MIENINKSINSRVSLCLLLIILIVFYFTTFSWSSDQSLDKARSYFVAGNWSKTVDELKQVLADNPQDGLAHLMIAFCYFYLDDETAARVHYDQAFTFGEKDPRVHWFLGLYYEEAGDYEKAISSYVKIIQLSPNDQKPYLNLASIYVAHTGEYSKAKKILMKCLRLNLSKKSKIKVYYLLASASKTESEQKKYLKKVLKIDPDNPEAKTILRFIKMGNEYDRNIAISSMAEKHFIEAEKLFRENKFEQAMKEYSKVIELEPRFAKAYLYLGDCYFRKMQYEKALPYFEKATELDPENPQTWVFLGDVYIYLGDIEAGYQYYKKAVHLDPEYHNAVAKLEKYKKVLEVERQ